MLGDPVGLAQALNGLEYDHTGLAEFVQADLIVTEALALSRSVGDPLALASALCLMGNLCRARKQYERAAELLKECMSIVQNIERPSYRALSTTRALVCLGRTEYERGANDEAISLFKTALAMLREWGIAAEILSTCLGWLAAAYSSADAVRAARLFGAAETQWRSAGARRFPVDQVSHEVEVRAVHAMLQDRTFTSAWNEGQTMDVGHVFVCALDESS